MRFYTILRQAQSSALVAIEGKGLSGSLTRWSAQHLREVFSLEFGSLSLFLWIHERHL
jgi:hypothetical protein